MEKSVIYGRNRDPNPDVDRSMREIHVLVNNNIGYRQTDGHTDKQAGIDRFSQHRKPDETYAPSLVLTFDLTLERWINMEIWFQPLRNILLTLHLYWVGIIPLFRLRDNLKLYKHP